MTAPATVRSALLRTFAFTLISLFAIPAITLLFTRYVMQTEDAVFLQSIDQRVAASSGSSAGKEALAYYRSHPLSSACAATAAEDREFHEKVCEPLAFWWQFHWAQHLALWTLIGGAVLLFITSALSALAFTSRRLRYGSFVAGWRLTTVTSAVEVLV